MMSFQEDWDRCVPWLQSAIDASGENISLAGLQQDILACRKQLWTFPRGAMVTEQDTPGNLHIHLYGGDMEDLKKAIPEVEQYAQQAGLATLTVLGRKGWARTQIARERGYQPVAVLLRKEL